MDNMTTTTSTPATDSNAPQSTYAKYAAKAALEVETLTFGIEIETKGNGKRRCGEIVAIALGAELIVEGGWKVRVRLDDGREWSIVDDGSLSGTSAEIVSPILKGAADIEMVQKIVRALRRPDSVGMRCRGCTVDSECGIHVHIGIQGWEAKAVTRLVKFVYSQEDLLIAMLQCESRTDNGNWCRRVSEDFMSNLPSRPNTTTSIGRAWYGSNASHMASGNNNHYHGSRYRGLNLHNMWYGPGNTPRGTVEFRYFNATLHAGKIRSFIELSLALAARAKLAKGGVARKRTRAVWKKYDARVLMLRLGMMGDRYASPRQHLMAHLAGNSRNAGTGQERGGVARDARNGRDNVTHTH